MLQENIFSVKFVYSVTYRMIYRRLINKLAESQLQLQTHPSKGVCF